MGDQDDKSDLTRIEDLSEFLHDEEEDGDDNFDSFSNDHDQDDNEDELPGLPDDDENEELSLSNEQEQELASEADFSDNDSFGDEKTDPDIDISGLEASDDFSQGDNDFSDTNSEDSGFGEDQEFESFGEEHSFEGGDESFNFSSDEQGDDQGFEETDDSDFSASSEDNEFDSSFDEEEQLPPDLPNEEENELQTRDSASEDSLEDDLKQEFENESSQPEQTEDVAPVQAIETQVPPAQKAKSSEDFSDIKNFAEAISYGDMSGSGNPPFSILLSGLRYKEDQEDIIIMLKEYGIIKEGQEEEFKTRLERGGLLIPRISEYAAIFLSHKLRRFDIEIKMGPSDLVKEPKNYKAHEDRGLITKHNVHMNKKENINFEKKLPNDFYLTTLNKPENKEVLKYLGIVTAKVYYEEKSTTNADKWNESLELLNQKLKNEAYKLKAQGLIGVNYQVGPSENGQVIIGFGNAVLFKELGAHDQA